MSGTLFYTHTHTHTHTHIKLEIKKNQLEISVLLIEAFHRRSEYL